MFSKRLTVIIADRSGRRARRFKLPFAGALLVVVAALALPGLLALGARLSVSVELAGLRTANQALRLENESYRGATGQLTEQIAALQAVVHDLSERAKVDPAAAAAMSKLPPMVRNRAMGGTSVPPHAARTLFSAAVSSPESTFGVLKDLLFDLEDRLQLVRTDVERWQALSRATPSIWPALGWLTGGFGRRADPFTGEPAQHLGLDISGERGQPVFATADGVVQSAGWSGDFGNLVVLSHEFGLTTRYAHLSRIVVTPGTRVRRGDVVGHLGSSGRSSGAHLHYEVWANGQPINPLRLLTASKAR